MISTNEKLAILCDDCTTMTDWEVEFVDRWSKWVAMKGQGNKGYLKEGIRDKINEIYEERMVNNG